MKQMDEVARQGARAPEKQTNSSRKEKDADFEQLKPAITGFARIIKYTVDGG